MFEIRDYFCPNEQCKDYGLRDMGNLVKAGRYTRKRTGETKQMLQCKVWRQDIRKLQKVSDTIFFKGG